MYTSECKKFSSIPKKPTRIGNPHCIIDANIMHVCRRRSIVKYEVATSNSDASQIAVWLHCFISVIDSIKNENTL